MVMENSGSDEADEAEHHVDQLDADERYEHAT
jgi:hypothetical protein